MIVYRTGFCNLEPRQRLVQIAQDLHRWAHHGELDRDNTRDVLVQTGVVESGVADALEPDADTVSPLLRQLRHATCSAGRLFVASLQNAPADVRRRLASEAVATLEHAAAQALPESIAVSLPEGYAYYALYPEQYCSAAADIASTIRPENAVCIGVRSIGTSLSAAVAATLRSHGCNVHSYTVRPRGAPFDRQLVLTSAVARELGSHSDALFIVVDEGPGLSGSSFASVARALGEMGIPDRRIVLMPGWLPDGSRFVSDSARAQWQRHDKFATSFDDQWLNSRELARAFGSGAELVDMSAGQWRSHVYADRRAWPVVHPQHERRKYLLRENGGPPLLLGFSGLGDIGRDRYQRAEILADAGYSPAPVALRAGFIATEFLPAIPLGSDDISTDILDRLAEYLGFVAREFGAPETTSRSDLDDMIRVNCRELLDSATAALLERHLDSDACTARSVTDRPVALDARMFPHEWIRCASGLLKTDAVNHHDDHFFPGVQDIAWDLAGTAVEFGLDGAGERYLLERYALASGDRRIGRRVQFHRIAYLSFRLGYAALAADTLEGDDSRLWRVEVSRYRRQLRRSVAALPHAA